MVRKKTREVLAARFHNRPITYPQTVRPDHRPAVSLVIEKESEKKGLGRPKGSKNRAAGRAGNGAFGDVMDVNSAASERKLVKRLRGRASG